MINLEGYDLNLDGYALIKTADLSGARLQKAYLNGALLRGAKLMNSKLQAATLIGADLSGADLSCANLEGADLENVNLTGARLSGASLRFARLQGTRFSQSALGGADFTGASLHGASLEGAVVDGSTRFWNCKFDKSTSFLGVGLSGASIEPGFRVALEANIRRLSWASWSARHAVAKFPVNMFWWLSDFGTSTTRVLFTFFATAVIFAFVYAALPELTNNLGGHLAGSRTGGPALTALRALYFSIVTMTTLGFGDIHANPISKAAHILLILQVLLGYFFLAVLVTRLSIILQSPAPSAEPTQPDPPGPREILPKDFKITIPPPVIASDEDR
ncbi:MAG: pentapeptide repeat-containing protein [bacterium]